MTRERFLPVSALLVYLALVALLLPHMLWFVNNPDTFQYLMLSHRWADGSFLNVINGYWSPLIIWLLIIPLKIFSNGIIAFKVLQILIGACTLLVWHRLLIVAKADRHHALLLFAAIPFLIIYSVIVLTADLLLLTLALVLLTLFIEGDPLRSTRSAIKLGVTGALLYLAKSFGFPMFLAVLALHSFLEVRKRPAEKVHILRKSAVALGAFLVIAMPWVIAMSMRYGHFTISEAARFNQTVEVAPMPEEIKQMPLITDGTFIPSPGAISAWETPGDMVELTPLRPWTHPERYMLLVKRNLLSIYYLDVRRQLGMIFLPFLLIGLLLKGRELLRDKVIFWSLVFIFVMNAGYSLILVHDRYIWINTFLMLLLCALIMRDLMPAWPRLRLFLMAAIVLLAIKRPVKQILLLEDADVSRHQLLAYLLSPVETLRATYKDDHVRMQAIKELKNHEWDGPVASLFSEKGARLSYPSTMHLAYELGLTFHGEVSPDDPREVKMEALRKQGVRYFAVWEGMAWDEGRVLFDAGPEGPRIYEFNW